MKESASRLGYPILVKEAQRGNSIQKSGAPPVSPPPLPPKASPQSSGARARPLLPFTPRRASLCQQERDQQKTNDPSVRVAAARLRAEVPGSGCPRLTSPTSRRSGERRQLQRQLGLLQRAVRRGGARANGSPSAAASATHPRLSFRYRRRERRDGGRNSRCMCARGRARIVCETH